MSISQQEIHRQERELRSQLESGLRKHAYYSPDEIDEVMKTFKYFGLKAIDQLKYLNKDQLMDKGIPTVTAAILKEDFSGGDAGNKKYTGDANTFWTNIRFREGMSRGFGCGLHPETCAGVCKADCAVAV